ncbi:hypothetical protein [Verrucomicrobium sp. BvORR106]|uniref:hypothetical protein n=1 Tax=Verrucomicrobium sp. BvORR106 TaxID=1403819 RepID=UPI00056F5577|nr:hypothetical protein [Verrucomicrobium sp. BvORR106]
MRTILVSLALFGLVVLPVSAHNNYFLPGDAFFSVTLTRELMEKWMKSEEAAFEFSYDRFDGDFFACGNIGYASLVVDGITPELRQALTEAYWRFASSPAPTYQLIEDDGKGQLTQTNGVVALIYNKDFKVGEDALGLKFNEDWSEQGAGRYCGYIDASEAVMRDWRGAKGVAPLAVREKPSATAHLADNYEVAHTMESTLHIGGKEIMIVLVGIADYKGFGTMTTCPDLKGIFNSEVGAVYTLVKEGTFREFSCNEDGVWSAEAVKLPVPSGESRVPEKIVTPVVR